MTLNLDFIDHAEDVAAILKASQQSFFTPQKKLQVHCLHHAKIAPGCGVFAQNQPLPSTWILPNHATLSPPPKQSIAIHEPAVFVGLFSGI